MLKPRRCSTNPFHYELGSCRKRVCSRLLNAQPGPLSITIAPQSEVEMVQQNCAGVAWCNLFSQQTQNTCCSCDLPAAGTRTPPLASPVMSRPHFAFLDTNAP